MDITWFLQINYITVWRPCSHCDILSVKINPPGSSESKQEKLSLFSWEVPKTSEVLYGCACQGAALGLTVSSSYQRWPSVPGERHSSPLTTPCSNQLVGFGRDHEHKITILIGWSCFCSFSKDYEWLETRQLYTHSLSTCHFPEQK